MPYKSYSKIKRPIDRLTSQKIETLSGTEIKSIIHTCDDAETLVRMIIMVCAQGLENIDADIAGFFQWMVQVKPSGTQIELPSVSDVLNKAVPTQEITTGIGQVFQNSATCSYF